MAIEDVLELQEYLEQPPSAHHKRTAPAEQSRNTLPAIGLPGTGSRMPATHWLPAEDDRLLVLAAKYPGRWGVIGMHLQRVARDCRQRWEIIA